MNLNVKCKAIKFFRKQEKSFWDLGLDKTDNGGEGTASLKNSLAVSHKPKYAFTIQTRIIHI